MAGIGDIGEAAPAVGNLLVLGEHVGDQRERANVRLERLGERLRCRLARCRVCVLHEIERRLDGEPLRADFEAQAGDRLVEQPVPCGVGGDGFLVEQLLDAVFELIRLVLADVLEPGPIMAERGIAHRRFELGVVEPIKLEHEEQKVDRRRGDALLHVGIELSACRIDGVAGVNEGGE